MNDVILAGSAGFCYGVKRAVELAERTAREGIRRLTAFFRSLGMPTTFAEIGAKSEDIPAMVAHRGEKPGGFPFGGFVEIGPKEMEAVLRLAAEQ